MLIFTTLSAASTLDEDVDMLRELAFMAPRAESRLVEEVERLVDDV